jgi:hypothetical protein
LISFGFLYRLTLRNEKKEEVMPILIGKRYVCKVCGGGVIVTKGSKGTLLCCDKEMVVGKLQSTGYTSSQEKGGTQLGKRYSCPDGCKAEVLCIKAGKGKLSCCGQEMRVQEAKPIPGSD